MENEKRFGIRTGDEVIYTSDVHPQYTGEIGELREVDLEHKLVSLKFEDGEILWAFSNEIKPVEQNTEDVETHTGEVKQKNGNIITLEFDPEEIIKLQRALEEMSHESMYEWEGVILKRIKKKLNAAYKKPEISEAELKDKLDLCQRDLKRMGLTNVENCLLSAERHWHEFHYDIKK